jgi:hypothetical protein
MRPALAYRTRTTATPAKSCMSECAALLCHTKQSAPAGSPPWSSPVNAETTRRCSSWKKLVVTSAAPPCSVPRMRLALELASLILARPHLLEVVIAHGITSVGVMPASQLAAAHAFCPHRHCDDAHDPRRGERRRPRLQVEILSERPVAEATQIIAPLLRSARNVARQRHGARNPRGFGRLRVRGRSRRASDGLHSRKPVSQARGRANTRTAEPRGTD